MTRNVPAAWKPFPHADKAYAYTAASLKKAWPRLHAGDREPLPADAAVLDAWRAYHAGDFAKAVELGLKAGLDGYNAANKAAMIYANYLEDNEDTKLALFQEIARRSEALQEAQPDNANAWYLHAYALGRYSQGISVAKALAQGLGGKVKESLDRALDIEPNHADAHIALGAWHAEIIDKVGGLMGGLTYGAKKDTGDQHYRRALELNPDTAIGRTEYANGLIMLFGKGKMKEAEALYTEAAAFTPMDAMERLDVEAAKAELED